MTSPIILIPGQQITVACGGGSSGSAYTYLLRDDYTSDQAAYGSGASVVRTCEPGPGTLYTRNATFSYIAGQRHHILASDTGFMCREEADRARLAGRLHRISFATRDSGSGQAYRFGLSRASELVIGPYYPSFENKVGVLRMNDFSASAGYSVIIDDELSLSTTYDFYIMERVLGGFLVRKIGDEFHLLAMAHVSDTSVCQGIENNGAVNFGQLVTQQVVETGFVVAPLVSHSFSEGDTSTIGASDGSAVEETGGSGVTPTEAGNNLEVASQRLQLSEDGTGYLTWEAGESDVHATCKITPIDGSPVGIVVRFQDVDNCWILELDSAADTGSGTMTLIKREAGVESVAATEPWSEDSSTVGSGTEHQGQVNANGDIFHAFISGVPSPALHVTHVAHTSSFLNTATKHGIRIKKGVGAASAKARLFACWPRAITDFPDI